MVNELGSIAWDRVDQRTTVTMFWGAEFELHCVHVINLKTKYIHLILNVEYLLSLVTCGRPST